MPRQRLLVLDADIDKRVAVALRKRGRTATSVYTLGVADRLDPELLAGLNDLIDVDWVLFTADDRMPFEHPEAIASIGIAVATIDPRRTDEYGINEWRHEIVHRWAHVAQEQPQGLIRRYSLNSYRVWRARKHYRMPFSA